MKLFVWDFHGVLEKGNEFAVQEVCNKVLADFGIKRKVTLQECLDLYGKKWADYFRYFAPHFDEEKILQIVFEATKYSLGKKIALKYIKPMDNAHDVLKKIIEKGHINIIMSNSSPESLDYFLKSVNIKDMFQYKYGADQHKRNTSEERSKEEWLKEFLQQHKFDDMIVIDDLHEGIDMGRRLGAITYHFNKNRKIKADADYCITDLREVLKEL